MHKPFVSRVMLKVVPVNNAHRADALRLWENTYRVIDIGLRNKMALMCNGGDSMSRN